MKSQKVIKVIIIDDSLLVRNIIADLVSAEPDIEVVATGKTGMDAVELSKKLHPDLIILDIEMPIMDGLTALEELKKLKLNIPVLMLSVLTQHGAEATFRALELGAIDFIPKPSSQVQLQPAELGKILIQRIRGYFETLQKSGSETLTGRSETALPRQKSSTQESPVPEVLKNKTVQKSYPYEAICIGTSTGGPKALQTVISALPGDLKYPVLVVQHMPAGFTKAFAERMNSFSKIRVKEAENGEPINPGWVYVAPGDHQMRVRSQDRKCFIELDKGPAVNGHRPSIEVLFDSAREAYSADRLVSVIMTGMGKDGAEAIRRIRDGQGYTIAQDEETSVIYGMNRQAIEIGGIDRICGLGEISEVIMDTLRQRERGK
jgi:two-component system chemotaxis response regulator CheB